MNSTTAYVIQTELKAWAVEAISAMEVAAKTDALDENKKDLIAAWTSIELEMLSDIKTHSSKNEVLRRLRDYIVRGVKMKDDQVVQEWANENIEMLKSDITKLQKAVTAKLG